ncbi:MAG TPA: ABC transporter permease [Gemmatimonadales bacterium]|nr:ABC transporter permease [Gemmatimonadales bacterium]
MPLYEAIRLAFQTIRAQKLKSAFSVIGVFIGVTFLIAAVSIVNGMNRYMTDKFAGSLVGVNTFHLRQRPDINFNVTDSVWRAWRRRPRITFADADAVSKGLTVPALTSWFSEDQGTVEYGGKVAKGIDLQGAGADYFAIKNYNLAEGRPFSPQEAKAGSAVVVLGWDLAQKLFAGVDPIGKTVRVQGLPYLVVGVIEQQGSLLGMSLDKFLVAPATSPIQRDVNPPHVVDAVMVKATTVEGMNAAMDQVEGIMRSRHHLRPSQDDNFAMETAAGVLDFWNGISRIMFAVGPGIVTVSLVVGGIVIMNIMLMAVAERTREIGVRKSLGARRRDILRQFLAESATLAVAGASVGILTGILLSVIINAATPLPASVAPWSVITGVILGAGVGIVAGVYPASRAARLDPITALRQE